MQQFEEHYRAWLGYPLGGTPTTVPTRESPAATATPTAATVTGVTAGQPIPPTIPAREPAAGWPLLAWFGGIAALAVVLVSLGLGVWWLVRRWRVR